jgi:hypothetical protein
MSAKRIWTALIMLAATFLLYDCNSKVFKDYLKNSEGKGIYIPSGVLMPDIIAPDISMVTATSHTNVRIVFYDQSGGLDALSAANPGNYRVQGQNSNSDVPVLSAAMGDDNLTVDLTLAPAPGMIHGMYTLVVSNVADVHNNPIATKTAGFLGRGAVTAMLAGAPPSQTKDTSIDITVGGDDIVAYKYQVDTGAWSGEINVSDHIRLDGLADATYALSVIGKDSLNNWQPLSESTLCSWTVDTVAPCASLSNKPLNCSNNQNTDIMVGGADVVAYKYRLDGGSWSGEINAGICIAETGLADGCHTIEVIGRDQAGNWQSDPDPFSGTCSWTIDTTAPVAGLSNLPANPTNIQDASIQVGGADMIEYAYRIDGGAWIGGGEYPLTGIDISQAIDLIGLSEGSHTIDVIGRDDAGNWQKEFAPTTFTWTIDTTAPTGVILSNAPQNPTKDTGINITVGGSDVAYYRYKLDNGKWWPSETEFASAATHITAQSKLSDGKHTLYVIGCDLAGNVQATPTSYTWSVDTTPPAAALSGTPANASNTQKINVTVGGTDVQAYMYKIDSEDWSAEIPISTAITRSGLGEGTHTLCVVGRDTAGNWQEFGDSTNYAWTIDTTPPVAALSNTPPNPTNQPDIDITVAGAGVTGYRYQIDGAGWNGDPVGGIDTSIHIKLSGLSAATHILDVVGRDAAGNWQKFDSASSCTWLIDLSVPTVVLSNKPSDPTNQTSAVIHVGGTNVVSYEYSLDGGPWSGEIDAVTDIILAGLSEATHTLYVIAKNAAGTWQDVGSATAYTWSVDLTPPGATLSGTPANPTNDNSADITVGGDGVVYYRYNLNGGGWSADIPVATHIALSGLSEKSHTISVVGRDAAGNYQAIQTSYTWTVDMTPPYAPTVSDTGTYDPDGNLDFTWINSDDVVEAKIQIATDVGFASVVYGGAGGASVGAASSYIYTISQSGGPRYYARVMVRDAANNWSGWGTASNGIDVIGSIAGKVKDTENHEMSGATVALLRVSDGSTVASASTNGTGDFTFTNVPIGTLYYEIDASCAGYYNSTKTNITVSTGAATDIGVIYIVSTTAQPGTISGRTVNANNGTDLGNTTVNIYDWSGALVETLSTNSSDGTFTSGTRQPGAYTIVFRRTGYFDLTVDNIIVNNSVGNSNTRYALCEILAEPHLRVVVQWGSSPRDLDLHVVGPTNKSVNPAPTNRFHVYWNNFRSFDENTGTYSSSGDPDGTSSTTSLVQDSRQGYGPEAINLFGHQSGYANGIYTYTVHNFSQSDWYTAPITMRVFDSQGLVMQLSVPNGAGQNLWFWEAIKITITGESRSQRTIQVQNTFNNLTLGSKSSMDW